MKNNNKSDSSKLKLLWRQLFKESSSKETDQQVSEAWAEKKLEKEQLLANVDSGDIIKILKKINNLSDEFKILRDDIEAKDKEIQRYKEGYDASRVKDFFVKFTFVDSVIKEYLADNEIDLDGLRDIQIQMNEAFAEFGIEPFSPEIGTEIHKVTDEVEENFKKIATKNKSEHSTIAEIVKVGYRRKLPDSTYQIISKSKVRVFVFEE